MTNFEKYKDKIVKMSKDSNRRISCCIYDIMHGTDNVCGYDNSCVNCTEIAINWLFAKYVKPKTDWSKVPRGTKVLVWDYNEKKPEVRKFFDYDPSFIEPFIAYDQENGLGLCSWRHCELAEDE